MINGIEQQLEAEQREHEDAERERRHLRGRLARQLRFQLGEHDLLDQRDDPWNSSAEIGASSASSGRASSWASTARVIDVRGVATERVLPLLREPGIASSDRRPSCCQAGPRECEHHAEPREDQDRPLHRLRGRNSGQTRSTNNLVPRNRCKPAHEIESGRFGELPSRAGASCWRTHERPSRQDVRHHRCEHRHRQDHRARDREARRARHPRVSLGRQDPARHRRDQARDRQRQGRAHRARSVGPRIGASLRRAAARTQHPDPRPHQQRRSAACAARRRTASS